MDLGTRTTATWAVAGALVVVVVSGAVVGTRDVGRAVTPQVEQAVRSTAPDQVGVEVTGREVRIDPWSASDAVVQRTVDAVEDVPGVRSVEVRPIDVGTSPRPTSTAEDIDLALEVSPTGVAFSSAVPSKALADEIGRRVARVRGVPVAVDLAVDTTLARPRWWPALGAVLDDTAQVDDLRLTIRDGVLEVEGTTAAPRTRARVAAALEEQQAVDDVRVSLTAGATRLGRRQAQVLEGTRITFGIGSDVLGPRGRADLDRVAAVMARADVSLDVLGHAGPADPERGDSLAADRAAVVCAYLVARGVPAGRLVSTAIGSGDDRGIDPRSALYRRVDFRVEER